MAALNKNHLLECAILLVTVLLLLSTAVLAADLTPEMIEQGKKAVEQGIVTPQEALQLQKKASMGTLTQAEIEAGKKLLKEQSSREEEPIEPRNQPPAHGETEAEAAPVSSEAYPAPSQPVSPVQNAPSPSDQFYFQKTDDPKRPELPLFGHNLFTTAPSTFAPVKNIPVPNDYIVGPGDEIKVMVWGLIDAAYALEVDKNGAVNLPKIGQFQVSGLTFRELKVLIKSKAEETVGVHASVSMGNLRSIQVMVLGEVKTPGVFTVSAMATVANALLTSGGPTPLGSLRNVQLKRQGKTVAALDFYDFLLKGDTSADRHLMPGDVIFVPQIGPLAYVSGDVKRPAAYELKPPRTLITALRLAGGLSANAYNQRIQIERAFDNKKQIVLDISEDELQSKSTIPLQDGDLIRVLSILPTMENAVYLYGNVRRPGRFAYHPGIKTSDLLPDIESLAVDTYFDYALIKRYRLRDMRAELLPFDLGRLLLDNDQAQNITLMPRDEVYVFNKEMFRDMEYAQVQGEVRRPGRFPIQDMTVRDLILKAGDLTTDAYPHKAELIRVDENRGRHTLYFDLGAAMKNDARSNLVLKNEDRVIIHSIWEEQWKESVQIKGEVKSPGSYTLTSGMRLTDLIFKAGNFTRDAYLDIGHLYRTDWRTRKKTILTFDLAKALKGDETNNLLLQDLDEVVVHNVAEYVDSYTVSIKGSVNHPGDYPYAGNMTIKDLLIVAGNVKDAAYLDEAELVRFSIMEGKRFETMVTKFNIRKALAGDPADNLKLKPLDVVTIKEIPDWLAKKKTVAIGGEVYFPGIYQIRKNERISDIVQRAGGYTEYAYLRGAVFTRRAVKILQKRRLADLADKLEMEVARATSKEVQTAISPQDSNAQTQFISSQKVLLEKLKDAEPTGRVVITLKPVEELKGSDSDLTLEDGDTLHISKKPSTVNVLGAVYNPTALAYNEKQPELWRYLEMTGGPTENAQEESMYVIQANGTVISSQKTAWWGDFENTRLKPGDTVLVPERVIRPSYMRDFKDITQILYQIATTAGVTALLF